MITRSPNFNQNPNIFYSFSFGFSAKPADSRTDTDMGTKTNRSMSTASSDLVNGSYWPLSPTDKCWYWCRLMKSRPIYADTVAERP